MQPTPIIATRPLLLSLLALCTESGCTLGSPPVKYPPAKIYVGTETISVPPGETDRYVCRKGLMVCNAYGGSDFRCHCE